MNDHKHNNNDHHSANSSLLPHVSFAESLVLDRYGNQAKKVSSKPVQLILNQNNLQSFLDTLKDPITNQQRYLFYGSVNSSISYNYALLEIQSFLLPVQGNLHGASYEEVLKFVEANNPMSNQGLFTTKNFLSEKLLIGYFSYNLGAGAGSYVHTLTGHLIKIS